MTEQKSFKKRPPHRKYITRAVLDKIGGKACVHFDAWLLQRDDNDALFFIVRESLGGWSDATRTHAFYLNCKPMSYLGIIHNRADPWSVGAKRLIDGKWARMDDYTEFLDAHHKALLGWIVIRFAWWQSIGPYTSKSVKLHYVYTDPKIDDPMAGMYNMYEEIARSEYAERRRKAGECPDIRLQCSDELATMLAPEPARRGRPPSPWTKAQRSMLRTLDKLLK